MATLSGSSDDRRSFTIYPEIDQRRSQGTEVDGLDKNLRAILASAGYVNFLSFHQFNGFASESIRGS